MLSFWTLTHWLPREKKEKVSQIDSRTHQHLSTRDENTLGESYSNKRTNEGFSF